MSEYEFPDIPDSVYDQTGGTVNHRRIEEREPSRSLYSSDHGSMSLQRRSAHNTDVSSPFHTRTRVPTSTATDASPTAGSGPAMGGGGVPASALHDSLRSASDEVRREGADTAQILRSVIAGDVTGAVRGVADLAVDEASTTHPETSVSRGETKGEIKSPAGSDLYTSGPSPQAAQAPARANISSDFEPYSTGYSGVGNESYVVSVPEVNRYHHLHRHHSLHEKFRAEQAQVGMPFGYSEQMSSTQPSFTHIEGGTRITHRSLITVRTVKDNGYHVMKYPINPGLGETFPWTNQIANRFEKYSIHALSFKYVPRVAATSAGTVAFSSNFDAGEPSPASLINAMQSEYATDGVIWEEQSWPDFSVKSAKSFTSALRKKRLIRNTAQGNDIVTLYDALNVYFIVDGSSVVASAIGDIWIEYSVDLFHPHVGPTSAPPSQSAIFSTKSDTFADSTTNRLSMSSIYDAFGLLPEDASTGGAPTSGVDGARLLPAGLWRITWAPVVIPTSPTEVLVDVVAYIEVAPIGTTSFVVVANSRNTRGTRESQGTGQQAHVSATVESSGDLIFQVRIVCSGTEYTMSTQNPAPSGVTNDITSCVIVTRV